MRGEMETQSLVFLGTNNMYLDKGKKKKREFRDKFSKRILCNLRNPRQKKNPRVLLINSKRKMFK